MKSFKKFLLMFIASAITFIVLASIDDYKTLILPFFIKSGIETKTVPLYKEEKDIKEFIEGFNSLLSKAYLSSDPSSVNALPAADSFKRALVEDIKFLLESNKIMDISVNDVEIEEISRLSPFAIKVKAKEHVSFSYLNLSDKTVVMPRQVAEYRMVYTLGIGEEGWTLVGSETMGVNMAENKKNYGE